MLRRTKPLWHMALSMVLALLLLLLPACQNQPAESSDAESSLGESSAQSNTDSAPDTDTSASGGSSAASTGKETSNSMNNTTENGKSTTFGSKATTKQTAGTTKAPAADDPYGASYSYAKDTFYKRSKFYSTWINVWYGSTESWYINDKLSAYTAKLKVNGSYVTPDNDKQAHREEIFRQAKDAGIDTLVMDLTNGYNGWNKASKAYQQMCYNNGMKFAVAVHPRITDGVSDIEKICEFTWNNYAGPGKALYAPSYFYKDGKPLIVLYCTYNEFKAAVNAKTTYQSRFTFTWASGEDSKPDKWGWQLVAQDGPQLSSDSMFVTCSVNWNSPNGSKDSWRKSLAFLDFCFLAAKEADPKYTVVGMIDDTHERNGWMKMDTSKVVFSIPKAGDSTVPQLCHALQMRDIYGDISEDAYYNRVKSWLNGTVKPYHTGGLIADGAYTLTNAGNGKRFGVDRPAPGADRLPSTDVGIAFERDNNTSSMEGYYWFYYLGSNEYRITKLSSGLSLQPKDDKLIQVYDENCAEQRWILKKAADGTYQIVNRSTGKAICDLNGSDKTITLAAQSSAKTQQWKIEPVANRTFG